MLIIVFHPSSVVVTVQKNKTTLFQTRKSLWSLYHLLVSFVLQDPGYFWPEYLVNIKKPVGIIMAGMILI